MLQIHGIAALAGTRVLDGEQQLYGVTDSDLARAHPQQTYHSPPCQRRPGSM